MRINLLFLLVALFLYGCGSQSTINSTNTATSSNNTTDTNLNIAVNDWEAFTRNASDIESFKIGFVELVKRGELEKIQPLWDVGLAINNLSFNFSKLGRTYMMSESFKPRAESAIKKITKDFCSYGESDWHYIGSTSESLGVTTIHFRVMSDGAPQWCSFDIKKADNGYKIIGNRNMNLNYSTNDLFYDIDAALLPALANKSRGSLNFWETAPDSKTKKMIKLSSGGLNKEGILLSMKEDEVKDYGVMYLNWLIKKKKYAKARVVADELSEKIPDNYFPAYSGYWITSDEGNNQAAIKHLYQGLQYAPTDTLLYYFLFESTLAAKNYDLAVITLDTLIKAFDYNLTQANINTLKNGQAFTQSSHYQKWKQAQ